MQAMLVEFINKINHLEVVGSAKNTWEARRLIAKTRPDLVFLDEVLPGESSLDLLNELSRDGILVFLITGLEQPSPLLPTGALLRLKKPSWDTFEHDLRVYQDKVNEFFIINKT
ncbi:MAG: hypothetical protein HY072_04135 [Deltaproteobacteria bacterium]|nr:hypothetical protein [Deltaproteobacteria bacterium]